MLIDFEAKDIKNAKAVLENDLQVIEHLHAKQQIHQEEIQHKHSLWQKIKDLFKRSN